MDRRQEQSRQLSRRYSWMPRHRLPPAPSSPCESRQSPTHPPWLEVAKPRPDQPGATARPARPSSPDRPSAPSPRLRMAQPAAYSPAWCARRSPALAPRRSAHARPQGSPPLLRPAATLHPSPAGLRSSRTQAACTGPACSQPVRRWSARRLARSRAAFTPACACST